MNNLDGSSDGHTQSNNKFFARLAPVYDIFEVFLFFTRNKIVELLKPLTPAKVLDVACGTGSLAIALANAGHDVIGIDLSPDMLKKANAKNKPGQLVSFQELDATRLPFEDRSFDAVTISLALHDMPHEVQLKVLKEMKRVVKSDGRIIIADYLEPNKHPIASLVYFLISSYETKNYKPFVKRGLEPLLAEVGLTIAKNYRVFGLFQVVVLD